MLVYSYAECAGWCAKHGYPTRHVDGYVGGPEPYLHEPDFRFARFSIPDHAGRRVALAKNLIELLEEGADLLVQIGDWAVWPSGQHMPLFSRFREGCGDRRPLIEAPGQAVPAHDREDAISLLVLSILYLWNCHVLSSSGDHAIFLSHDQFGWVAVRGNRTLDRAKQLLETSSVLSAEEQETEPGVGADSR